MFGRKALLVMARNRDLQLITGALENRLAVMEQLWSDRGNELPGHKQMPPVVAEIRELLARVRAHRVEYIAEIEYANDPDKERIFVRVAAENIVEVERKVRKYIQEHLQGLRSYKLHSLEEV